MSPRVLLFGLLSLFAATALAAGGEQVDYDRVVAEIAERGNAAVAAYTPETGLDTADAFSALYFDVFEGSGMELAVGMEDPDLKGELESQFGTVIGHASQGGPKAKVAAAWETLRANLRAVAATRGGAETGFWALLVQSFLILLREGFEAILVVTALAAYLRRSGAGDRMPVLYHGVGWALVASAATAYALTVLFEVSGAAQEALEGVTMLVAAAVLFYVSYWLFAKREAARWQAYVQGRIDRALSGGGLFTLGFAAFLAVYREGAETVLFYQALAGQADGSYAPLAIGFGAAAVALGGVFWAMRSASLRLPLGLFFGVTAALLYYLAISFAGTGMLELQEAGWVPVTPLEGVPRVGWLGLHPTLESVAAQGLLLAPLGVALFWWAARRRPQVAG